MKTKTTCHRCGRAPVVPGEGRRADGSWPRDAALPKAARGKWFCCFGCYEAAIAKGKKP